MSGWQAVGLDLDLTLDLDRWQAMDLDLDLSLDPARSGLEVGPTAAASPSTCRGMAHHHPLGSLGGAGGGGAAGAD